ncbi:MAG: imidazole glycerol phosphate synthase subunit HisF [Candidatus Aminicenantes bacterium]|nr:imidazole glycerol phosphate synthase subunit HisF [Candidatus Aminicenantes bacterium]
MLTARIIPCLDIDEGQVVKGVRFRNLIPVGDPVSLARYYYLSGADEIIFLDIGASVKSRKVMLEIVEKISSQIFIPLTVGGGIRDLEDIRNLLLAGADKVSLCTAALQHPGLIKEAADRFGSQCIVLSIDAARVGSGWEAFSYGGSTPTGVDAVKWAKEAEKLGAGEILLNSIDRDGTQTGYDLELLRAVSEAVNIPVIASGGGGTLEHIYQALMEGQADAVLLASGLHFGRLTIQQVKDFLRQKGVSIR